MKPNIRFLIVDDQQYIRQKLAAILHDFFDKAQVTDIGSARHCLALIQECKPDIIFMDISMPEMDGIEATRQIIKAFPTQRVIAYSMNDDDETLNKMMQAGAKGYVLKTDDLDNLQEAVSTVIGDQIFISSDFKKKYQEVNKISLGDKDM